MRFEVQCRKDVRALPETMLRPKDHALARGPTKKWMGCPFKVPQEPVFVPTPPPTPKITKNRSKTPKTGLKLRVPNVEPRLLSLFHPPPR